MALLEDNPIELVINKNLILGAELLTEGYFYTGGMGAENKFSFSVGMTWREFINSNYNTDNLIFIRGYGLICNEDEYHYIDDPSITIDTPLEHKKLYEFNCYIKGTLITLSDFSTKKVEDITYEDELLVWDFDNGRFASAKPFWIKKPETAHYYYKLTFSDGTELGLVGSNGDCHRLLNIENKGFVYGTRFEKGEHTFKQDMATPTIVSIERIDEEVEFYNIITGYHMNCFVNGLLSSTRYNNSYPIEDMKFVKDSREMIPYENYEGIPYEWYENLRLGEQDLSKYLIIGTKEFIDRRLEKAL